MFCFIKINVLVYKNPHSLQEGERNFRYRENIRFETDENLKNLLGFCNWDMK